MKKFIILLFAILSVTVLCSCSGCSDGSLLSDKKVDLEDLANIIESNKNNASPHKSKKMIEDISRFKITDVVSVNCIKGYPVDEEGMALCEEQTVELIGLGDKGNLHFALVLLAYSKEYAKDPLSFERAFYHEVQNQWVYVDSIKVREKTDKELLELVKENDSIWIEYGENSLADKESSNVNGYIWFTDESEHNSDNFINSYNYQMLRGDFCVYDQANDSKYADKFVDVNKGEDIVVYGGTVEKVYNPAQFLIVFDNHTYATRVDIFGTNLLKTDGYIGEETDYYVSSVIKPGDYVYVELTHNDKIPDDGEIILEGIAGYLWTNNMVNNNYDDYMKYNYIALCLKSGELSFEDIDEGDKYYDKIMRYHNKY